MNHDDMQAKDDEKEARDAERKIRKVFEQIPNEIFLLLFTNPSKN